MLLRIFKVLAVAAILILIDMTYEANFPIVKDLSLYTDKLKKDKELVFLQISDLHGFADGEAAGIILKEAEQTKPDAVFITGDLADHFTSDFSQIYALLDSLKKICPNIYFICGNHEWSNHGRGELLEQLAVMGVKILNNKGLEVPMDGIEINICGVDDPYKRMDRIEEAMKDIDSGRYTILLSHSPGIRKRLGSHTPDLILCGHTHGGQVRLPLIGALIAPGEGLFPEFDKGLFDLGQGSFMYIDSGVGTSHLPLRFLNRSQISRIRIMGRGK